MIAHGYRRDENWAKKMKEREREREWWNFTRKIYRSVADSRAALASFAFGSFFAWKSWWRRCAGVFFCEFAAIPLFPILPSPIGVAQVQWMPGTGTYIKFTVNRAHKWLTSYTVQGTHNEHLHISNAMKRWAYADPVSRPPSHDSIVGFWILYFLYFSLRWRLQQTA